MDKPYKLYITKGDNCYIRSYKTNREITCDKVGAIEYKGRRYWLDKDFAYIEDFEREANLAMFEALGLNVYVKATRLSEHHDDLFCEGGKGLKNAIRREGDCNIWHDLQDIIEDIKAHA